MKINNKNNYFGQPSLECLDHIISSQGVSTDPGKVEAMWPILKDIKVLGGLLELTGYYRRFVQGYGKIAKPKKKGFNEMMGHDKLLTRCFSITDLSIP